MTAAAISISGLEKTYGARGRTPAKPALKGIDLDIPQGAIFGLLGPNGAGKSTLINILAGLVKKDGGRVSIWGFDQDINPRQSRASIGVVPQELNIDPFLTSRELLDVQAGLYGVPRAARRTAEILSLVGLSDRAEAYSRTLSGGMRRRLLLAKAMVHDPPVLVLDEPTAGVDIELREMLWTNIRAMNARGTTIILTTHYLAEAEEMCSEIAIISEGSLIARDTTANLIGRLDSKVLVVMPQGAVNPAGLTLPQGVEAELRAHGALAFSYRRGEVPVEAILAALRDAGVVIRDVSTEEADLEDVFRVLTRRA